MTEVGTAPPDSHEALTTQPTAGSKGDPLKEAAPLEGAAQNAK